MKNHAESLYFAGIDIGSTTAKAVILDKEGGMVFPLLSSSGQNSGNNTAYFQ
jgi:activator of 2-hydroxyglutaryl-CoA dehydratase